MKLGANYTGTTLNRHNIYRQGLVLFVLLSMSACSFKFIYPRADFFIGWQVDSYLRLESAQERWLDERLERKLRWHHQSELPRWREWLSTLRSDIAERHITPERYDEHMTQMSVLLRQSSASVINDSVELMQQLNDQQVEHLLKRLREDAAEAQEEALEMSEEEYREERVEKTVDNLQKWFGRLDSAQIQLVQTYVDQSPDLRMEMIESRARWATYINETLQNRANQEQLTVAVERMLTQPESLRTAEYHALWQQQGLRRREMLHLIYQSATERQREHLLEELDNWIEDLGDLIARKI